jgi:hypothetical protein
LSEPVAVASSDISAKMVVENARNLLATTSVRWPVTSRWYR